MPPARRPPADEAVNRDLQRAMGLQRQGQLDAAALLYQSVLKRRPHDVEALQLLGALQGQRGQLDAALALLEQALALDPHHVYALNNRGRALAQAGRHAQALESFDRSLALRPAQPAALMGRGRMLRKLNRPAEALACFDTLLEIDPASAEALQQRAQLLSLMAREDPQHHAAAVQATRAALPGLAPEDAAYSLAALGAGPAPAASPRHYVAGLFDQYAERFDSHLTGVLGYRTPGLMAQAVQQAGAAASELAVDLGCGTGLCGPWMRPLASRLVGVDLSQKMLDKARERGLYDELVCAEGVEFLAGVRSAVALIVAADVFVYVGDLQAVFAACAQVQPPGGLFAFSVEQLETGDFQLRETRRYAHGSAYVTRLAEAHGYATVSQPVTALRQEYGQDVMGTIFVLRRGA